MIRSSFIWRASHNLVKTNLFNEIEGNIHKFKTSQLSEIAEYQEIFKEKGFDLDIGKKSSNITLRKLLNNVNIELVAKAAPPENFNEDVMKIINPKGDKDINEMIEYQKSKGKRFAPVPIIIYLQKENEKEVMNVDIIVYETTFTVRSAIIIDENDKKPFHSLPDMFKPSFEKRLNRNIFTSFHAWLKTMGIEGNVLRGMILLADFHYGFLSNKWMEKVKKVIS